MNSKRIVRTGPQRPVRTFRIFGGGVAAFALATAVPIAPAAAQNSVPVAAAAGISDFYTARSNRPLWFSQSGRQVDLLLQMLGSAELDGLDPGRYRIEALESAVRAAQSGNRKAVRRADRMLSQAFIDYVRDLRRPGNAGVIYVDPELEATATVGLGHPRKRRKRAVAGALRRRDALDASDLRPAPQRACNRRLVAGAARPGAHQPGARA